MPKFVVIPTLGEILVGAVSGGDTREDADAAALALVRRDKGMIFDVMTGEKRRMDSILICEVIQEGTPVFGLAPKV